MKHFFVAKAGILSIRRWAPTVAIAGLLFGVYYLISMQPYDVQDGGVCLFVISPTDLNEGEILPCGSIRTLGSVPLSVYHGR